MFAVAFHQESHGIFSRVIFFCFVIRDLVRIYRPSGRPQQCAKLLINEYPGGIEPVEPVLLNSSMPRAEKQLPSPPPEGMNSTHGESKYGNGLSNGGVVKRLASESSITSNGQGK